MLAGLFRSEVRTENAKNAVMHMSATVVATSRALTPEFLLRLASATDAVTQIASDRVDATSFAQVNCVATRAVCCILRFVLLKLHASSCVMRASIARAFRNLSPRHRKGCGARSDSESPDDTSA